MIFRNHKIALEKVEETLKLLQDMGRIKYVKVDKVKLRNKITRTESVMKDLIFMATGQSSNNPMFVKGVRLESGDVYLLHEDLTHYNCATGFSEWHDSYVYDEGTRYVDIIYTSFCNPVKMKHLWDNPDTAGKILKGNILEGNPNDAYRQPDSVEIDRRVLPLYAQGVLLKSNATLEQVITHCINPKDCTNPEDLAEVIKIHKELQKDENMVYAYAGDADCTSPQYYYRLINKKDIEEGKYVISSYYKTYTAADIDGEFTVEKSERDVCCIGAGSAGSNIMFQLCKFEYFDKYTIIDFDTVELKNIRNQIYRTGEIGGDKVYKLSDKLHAYTPMRNLDIVPIKSKFQDATQFEIYKHRYVISALDSIECRQELLESILNKQIEAEYLIDTRYKDLTSSLFFVNLSDEKEVEYYKKLLEEDKVELDKEEEAKEVKTDWSYEEAKEVKTDWSYEEAETFIANEKLVEGNCSKVAKKIGLDPSHYLDNVWAMYNICDFSSLHGRCHCGLGENCILAVQEMLNKQKYPNSVNVNSCITRNYIHIYTMTSAWVLSAIRTLETEGVKPFTHVDITVDPVPNAMILKK